MKFSIAMMGALLAGAAAHARGVGEDPEKTVMVCLESADGEIVPASEFASRLFEGIGVRIDWRKELSPCLDAKGAVSIRFYQQTSDLFRPGSLACAMLEEGRIDIFLGRIRSRAGYVQPETLLAYVMAHEIAHILQGVSRHSPAGLMKAHWDWREFYMMRNQGLAFSRLDVDLIQAGASPGVATVPAASQ